ncbi:MAG: glycogen synthase GlgA [Nitrospirae bacterium]|nr:glycogen synthase GlgA [Nitrospirota bacterium]
MKILIATPEAVPFAKTGGLADVTGALQKEYRKMGHDAYLILPLYRRIKENFKLENTGIKISGTFGDRRLRGRILSDGFSAYFIECNELFDREELYGTSQGDYSDNALRFIFFSKGVIGACRGLKFRPDIIHCNDWQTAMVPLYLKTLYKSDKSFSRTASVITIHNLGYQGLFNASEMRLTGLDWGLFNPEGIEFYGKMNFLKAGLLSADMITTVSDSYAKEILSREYGFGLDGVLSKRASDIFGIINSIDYKEWNPLSDAFIPKNYSSKKLNGKKMCKLQLMKECSITLGENTPIVSMVGRLSSQKGLDLVLESLEKILSTGAAMIILGKGDENFQIRLSKAAKKYRGRLYVNIGFEDSLAHRIYAGSDIFLMPSRYEPCGLGQLIAMRYGTIPVVKRIGGLADTVSDYEPLTGEGTGFLFSDYTQSALLCALKSALCVYVNKTRWQRLALNAMNLRFSWRASAKKYIELYRYAIKKKTENTRR